jgi:Rieske Fe-S protein
MIKKKADSKQVLSRKVFIKYLGLALVFPVVGIWDGLVSRHKQTGNRPADLRITSNIPQGVSFHDELIVNKTGNGISIFSSRCTHLGCRIHGLERGELVCGCHGSHFNTMDGQVLKGPARQPLQQLTYDLDAEKNELVVHL